MILHFRKTDLVQSLQGMQCNAPFSMHTSGHTVWNACDDMSGSAFIEASSPERRSTVQYCSAALKRCGEQDSVRSHPSNARK